MEILIEIAKASVLVTLILMCVAMSYATIAGIFSSIKANKEKRECMESISKLFEEKVKESIDKNEE